MPETAEEKKQTTAVYVSHDGGIVVEEDADDWRYKSVGGGDTIISLINGVKPIQTHIPLDAVDQITLLKGEEAEMIIREAQKGNLE
jgi:hypothetical protein